MADDRRKLLADADQAARRGDLAAAAVCYQKLVALTPNDLTLLQRLGDTLARIGRESEARKVLLQLADEYWRGGFRQRALAVLKRAVRLGDPEPQLIEQLAERTLEVGLTADAREPLLEAAQLYAARQDEAGAERAYQRLIEVSPRDAAASSALLKLAERRGDAAAIASARVQLALVSGASGDPAAALEQLAAALVAAPEALAPFARLPELLRAIPTPPTQLWSARRSALPPEAMQAWDLLSVCFLIRDDQVAEARARLDPMLRDPAALHPRIASFAGRQLLELGDARGARALIMVGAPRLLDLGTHRAEVVDTLTALVSRDPSSLEAAELLNRVSAAASSPRRTGEIPIRKTAPQPIRSVASPLPDEVRAKLLEVRALISHGLAARGGAVLDSIPAAYKSHPELTQLSQEIAALARGTSSTAGGSQPRSASDPSAAASSQPAGTSRPKAAPDDDLLIVVDDEPVSVAPPRSPAPTATAGRVTTAPVAAAPTEAARPKEAFGHLSQEIKASVEAEDYETNYQLAIGLFEMGLEQQGLETLERARFAPGRQGEIALMLLQRHGQIGNWAKALQLGEEALDHAAASNSQVYANLLAGLAFAAAAAGDQPRRNRFVELLAGQFPTHPALESLKNQP